MRTLLCMMFLWRCVQCGTVYVLLTESNGMDVACSVATLRSMNSMFCSCGICSFTNLPSV
jgi:hypothetical protein